MRILAVTADASLITALNSMMLDWEIVHVREAADAKPKSEGAVIALVDSGTTDKGIETAKLLWTHGVTLPCLVIGDAEPPAGTRLRVMVRPFSLQDLTAAVDEVAQALPVDPGGSPTSAAAVEPDEEELLEPELPVDQAGEAEELFADAGQAESSLRPSPYAELETLGDEPVGSEEGDEPVASEEPIVPVVPPVPEIPPAPPVAPSEPAPPVTPRAAEPARPADAAPLRPAEAVARAEGGLRRFLRRKDESSGRQQEAVPEDPMLARLRNAIVAGRELEALVHELPVLAQPRAMAHAFLGEVVELFSPQVAAVFAPSFDGSFGVIAGHGLSAVEAGLKVRPEQPLFLEITQTLEAVLVAPLDLAQGLVAGIGGARTEALIAAPLAVGGVCHAIVVVGRQDFSEFDLELLAEQAEEAAPGLAVAQMIDRLRGL